MILAAVTQSSILSKYQCGFRIIYHLKLAQRARLAQYKRTHDVDHCKVKYKCGLGSLLNLLPFPRGYISGTLVFPSNTSKFQFKPTGCSVANVATIQEDYRCPLLKPDVLIGIVDYVVLGDIFFFYMSLVYDLPVTMFVFLLLLRPPIFRLNEDAILHIFLYLSAKDRIRIERGKYKSYSYAYYGKTACHFMYVQTCGVVFVLKLILLIRSSHQIIY